MTNLHDEIREIVQGAYEMGVFQADEIAYHKMDIRHQGVRIPVNQATTRILTVVREAVLAGLPAAGGRLADERAGFNDCLDQATDSIKRVLGGGE